MNWLKGLVAPPAQFGGPQQPQQNVPGMPPQQGDMPPYGGVPNQSPYGPQMGQPMGQPPMGPPPVGGQQMGLPDPMQWSTGTRTQGSAQQQGSPQGGISGSSITGGAAASGGVTGGSVDARIAALEARCVELQNDCGSLALFARTLLTMLEDGKIVTRPQFVETKNRLDMLDGKMDDR